MARTTQALISIMLPRQRALSVELTAKHYGMAYRAIELGKHQCNWSAKCLRYRTKPQWKAGQAATNVIAQMHRERLAARSRVVPAWRSAREMFRKASMSNGLRNSVAIQPHDFTTLR
jgi:hypothetical protein